MTNCARTLSLRCWLASSNRYCGRTASLLPARARSIVWNISRNEMPRGTTRSTATPMRSMRSWPTCSWRRQERPPRQIVIDVDATDIPLHGHQEGRFFHGYYDS